MVNNRLFLFPFQMTDTAMKMIEKYEPEAYSILSLDLKWFNEFFTTAPEKFKNMYKSNWDDEGDFNNENGTYEQLMKTLMIMILKHLL